MNFTAGFVAGLYVGVSITTVIVAAIFFYCHRNKQ